MANLLYRAVKISVAVIIAVLIAELLELEYSVTAGVVAMLSILDSRRQTYVVGLRRFVTAMIGLSLSFVLFYLLGFSLMVLGLFVLIFVPIVTWIGATEGLVVSTVLVTHVYSLSEISGHVFINETALLLIGVLIAFAINLHMPNVEKDIHKLQLETEQLMKSILHKMSLQLINQCPIQEPQDVLVQLDHCLSKGLEMALRYNNNYMLKDHSYYIRYFQMRRQQYELLVHMENHFTQLFIGVKQAEPLSVFTDLLAGGFKEKSTGQMHLQQIERLEAGYKKEPLPKTREEFENRARLYQYMNDLKYLIEIKVNFVEAFSELYRKLGKR